MLKLQELIISQDKKNNRQSKKKNKQRNKLTISRRKDFSKAYLEKVNNLHSRELKELREIPRILLIQKIKTKEVLKMSTKQEPQPGEDITEDITVKALPPGGTTTEQTTTDKDGNTITITTTTYSEAEYKLYSMVIKLLGVIVIIALISAIGLAVTGKTVPEFVVSLGSVAIGTLAGVLAPSPTKTPPETTKTTKTPPQSGSQS